MSEFTNLLVALLFFLAGIAWSPLLWPTLRAFSWWWIGHLELWIGSMHNQTADAIDECIDRLTQIRAEQDALLAEIDDRIDSSRKRLTNE